MLKGYQKVLEMRELLVFEDLMRLSMRNLSAVMTCCSCDLFCVENRRGSEIVSRVEELSMGLKKA